MTYGSYDLGRDERAGLEHALFVVQNSWQCAVLCCFEDWMNNVNIRRELQSAHNQHHNFERTLYPLIDGMFSSQQVVPET